MNENDTDPTVGDPIATEAVRRRTVSRSIGGERYQIGERLGSGGMGEVVSAHDLQLGRDVAIKRILADEPSEKLVERFMREAKIQGRLQHPAVAPVHELGRDGAGQPYFVMKRLTGITLADVLGDPAQKKHSRQRLLRAFADVCLAVEFAHSRGIIHRDLKPANIMLGEFGEVHVLDWGVARVLSEAADDSGGVDSGELTRDGAVIGTPSFMAPEQARGERVDARADVYALGCILFEMLVGQRLKERDGIANVREAAASSPREVPPELVDLCARATEASLDLRLASARSLGEGVLRYLDGDRDLALRRKLAEEHLVIAERALPNRDDEEQQKIAIRAAGQALALDPTLGRAADLVGRLMLEPPRTLPKDVEEELASDRFATTRRQAGIARWFFLGALAFLPFVAAIRGFDVLTAVFGGVMVIAVVLLWMRARNPRMSTQHAWVRNAVLVVIVSRVFSPPLLAPVLAVVMACVLMYIVSIARARDAITTATALIVAVLAPWAAELLGFATQTVLFHPDGIFLRSGSIPIPTVIRTAGLMTFYAAAVSLVSLIIFRMRKAELGSRQQLYLQRWQLKQLVETSGR